MAILRLYEYKWIGSAHGSLRTIVRMIWLRIEIGFVKLWKTIHEYFISKYIYLSRSRKLFVSLSVPLPVSTFL